MLKEQLLAEVQNIELPAVELDSIFESVDLSEEVKASFTTVFEQAVKTSAVKLAESHINLIAEKADTLLEEKVQARTLEIEEKLYEDTDKYFGHIADEWLKENKEAVSRDIKADLFESLVADLKTVFIDHNVVIPEAQVDVVAELEDELVEHQGEVKKLFEENQSYKKEIADMKRTACIAEKTVGLTESQVEKVYSLIEGLTYSDKFETKLTQIVEMVAVKKENSDEKKTPEVTKDDFKPVNENVPAKKSEMNKYVQAAKALN